MSFLFQHFQLNGVQQHTLFVENYFFLLIFFFFSTESL